MLKSVQFGDARADGPHAPCGTRSTSRAALAMLRSFEAISTLLQKMEGKINGDTTPDEVPNNDSDKDKVPREQYYNGRYSEEERVPFRGIMTAKTMPICQHNKPFREAKIGSKYFAADHN